MDEIQHELQERDAAVAAALRHHSNAPRYLREAAAECFDRGVEAGRRQAFTGPALAHFEAGRAEGRRELRARLVAAAAGWREWIDAGGGWRDGFKGLVRSIVEAYS